MQCYMSCGRRNNNSPATPEFRLLTVAHVQIALFLERMRCWRGTRFRKWTHRSAAGEVFAGCDPHPPHDINGVCVVFLKARLESGNSGQFVQAHHEESIHLRVPN